MREISLCGCLVFLELLRPKGKTDYGGQQIVSGELFFKYKTVLKRDNCPSQNQKIEGQLSGPE